MTDEMMALHSLMGESTATDPLRAMIGSAARRLI